MRARDFGGTLEVFDGMDGDPELASATKAHCSKGEPMRLGTPLEKGGVGGGAWAKGLWICFGTNFYTWYLVVGVGGAVRCNLFKL